MKGLLLGTVTMKDVSAQWVDHIDWRQVTRIGHVAGSCSQAPVFMWNAHMARFPASWYLSGSRGVREEARRAIVGLACD